jgi:hypothetical protein
VQLTWAQDRNESCKLQQPLTLAVTAAYDADISLRSMQEDNYDNGIMSNVIPQLGR